MGVSITVGGRRVQSASYRVSESSMPLAGGDSSGAVGSIEATVAQLPMLPSPMNLEEPISLIDTARGSTLGTIREVSLSESDAAPYSLTANNRLGEFNIEAQVLPFTGTLENAFRYYCSIANIDTGIVIDAALASRSVNFPGWSGNLWNHMKMMATAISADLNLISGNVVLRPVRVFEAVRNREVEISSQASGLDLARRQEVIWYATTYVPNGLIYPAGGYRSDITPLSVSAGETQEYVLDSSRDVSSSIFSIQQPTPQLSVAPDYQATSVYTVIGDDNIVIPPQQWLDYGGRVTVAIGEDTRSLVVTLTGASGLFQANGEPMQNFRLALSSDSSSGTYQTLRIVGQHISIQQNSIILPTGVPDFKTGQDFAPTIDNPFLNTLDIAYSAGVRGARRYAGRRLTISGEVSALNRRGQTGTANYPPYSYAQSLWSGRTYGNVPPQTTVPRPTYGQIQEQFYASVQDTFDNQIYGNAPGARMWDPDTSRWYRIRNATTEWNSLSIDADDDLTNGDIQGAYASMTYGQVQAMKYNGLTYHKSNLRGIA